jgi:hypothetical protein
MAEPKTIDETENSLARLLDDIPKQHPIRRELGFEGGAFTDPGAIRLEEPLRKERGEHPDVDATGRRCKVSKEPLRERSEIGTIVLLRPVQTKHCQNRQCDPTSVVPNTSVESPRMLILGVVISGVFFALNSSYERISNQSGSKYRAWLRYAGTLLAGCAP